MAGPGGPGPPARLACVHQEPPEAKAAESAHRAAELPVSLSTAVRMMTAAAAICAMSAYVLRRCDGAPTHTLSHQATSSPIFHA